MIGATAPPAGTDDGIVGRLPVSASDGVVVAVGSVVVDCACTDDTVHDNRAHPIKGDQMSRLRWARIVMEPSCHPGTGPMVGWKKSCTAFNRQVQPLASDWQGGVTTGGGVGGVHPTVQVGVGGMLGGDGGVGVGGSLGGVGGVGVGGFDGGDGGSDGGLDGGSDGGNGGAAGGSDGGAGGRLTGITGGESGGTPSES
jgi:hypothetical protein